MASGTFGSPAFKEWVRARLAEMTPKRYQKDLGEYLHVSDSHASRILDGRTGMPPEGPEKIATFLGVPLLQVQMRLEGKTPRAAGRGEAPPSRNQVDVDARVNGSGMIGDAPPDRGRLRADGGASAPAEAVVGAVPPRRPLVWEGLRGVPLLTPGWYLSWSSGKSWPLDMRVMDELGEHAIPYLVDSSDNMSRYPWQPGDIIWCDPTLGKAAALNRPVLVRLEDDEGHDLGASLKVLRQDDAGDYVQNDSRDPRLNEAKYRRFTLLAVAKKRAPALEDIRAEPEPAHAPSHDGLRPQLVSRPPVLVPAG